MADLQLAAATKIKIEKGIPMPDNSFRKKKSAWPLAAMDVGDSFAFDSSRLPALRAAITYEKRKHPEKKFTARSLPTESRCWRTA